MEYCGKKDRTVSSTAWIKPRSIAIPINAEDTDFVIEYTV